MTRHVRTRTAAFAFVLLAALRTADASAQETAVRLLGASPGVRRGTPATITYVVEAPVKAAAIEIIDGRGVARRFSSSLEQPSRLAAFNDAARRAINFFYNLSPRR